MPEKRNESKIMAMLERKGVLRKVGADDGSLETDPDGSATPNDSDIKPLFNVPDESMRVTPAARQPIPGMTTPVFPSDRSATVVIDQPQAYDDYDAEKAIADDPQAYEPDPFAEPEEAYEPSTPVAPASAAPTRPAPSFGGLNIFRNGNGSHPEEAPAPAPAAVERAPQPENYTDRFMGTEELYDALALRSKKTDSIYLIEDYLQTLPDSLPDSSRREIVSKLIAASGFDYDLLMGDGVLRVKMLKEYAERFARHTDDYIAARQAELDEMDQQILRTRRLIENRKDLHKKQFFSIEAEAQRLKEILTFISG